MTARDLYDRDFFEWTQCNAALLRAGRIEEADVEPSPRKSRIWARVNGTSSPTGFGYCWSIC